MKRNSWAVLILLLITAIVMGACGGGGQATSPAEQPGTAGQGTVTTATEAPAATTAAAGGTTTSEAAGGTATEEAVAEVPAAEGNAAEDTPTATGAGAGQATATEETTAGQATPTGEQAGTTKGATTTGTATPLSDAEIETLQTPDVAFLTRDYEGTSIKAYFGSVGDEVGSYTRLIENFTNKTGIKVEVVQAPSSSTDNLAQQLQFLGAGSSDLDVYQIDVIWPGILADHAVDLKQYVPEEEMNAHFPAIIENNTVNGKLVALPWYTDAGLLYYRTDLLEKYGFAGPPTTWDELQQMAQKIQDGERAAGNDSFWGFVWQGNNYEGLTCDALEWQVSEGGGRIIEPDSTITVNNPAAAAAFTRAAGWVNTISPPGVTTYQEEDARGVWQSGNAAFMRNWPYSYALGNSADSPIRGKFAATVLPAGAAGRSAATLGGWQIMVSKYSDNVEAAVMFARYITSPEAQLSRAATNSYLPTVSDLYSNSTLMQAQPFMGPLYDVFTNAVARPSTVTGDRYNEASAAYFNTVHSILTGEASNAEDALSDLEQELVDITGFETGQPQ